MTILRHRSSPLAATGALIFSLVLAASATAESADWVDPFIGTSATGHTSPAACVPFGLVQAGPDTFDPYALGHGVGRSNDFTEGNAFQYTWHVMQNPQGLIEAIGGRDVFVKKLDSLFSQPDNVEGMGKVLDVTGLIGQYVHGNEPSHHVIYFYPQVGHPEKAAERMREVFDRFYLPKPDGLCGNDDCGQMSAWYLFSAMGFYPFNPCGGEYVIGAPQVACAKLKVGSGEFRVVARNLSRDNMYVKSVTLNGKPLTGWKLRHSDIMAGGRLVFEMTKRQHEKGKTPWQH